MAFRSFCVCLQIQHNREIRVTVCAAVMMPVMGNRTNFSARMVMPSVMPVVPNMASPVVMIPFVPNMMIVVTVSFMGNMLFVMRPRWGRGLPGVRRPDTEKQNRSKNYRRCQIYQFLHKCHRLSFYGLILPPLH